MEEYKKDDRGRSKAQRLTKNDPQQKVDSSTWTPSAPENAGVKTGARPLVKRLYKKGGKVIGKDAMKRADRKPRKARAAGGGQPTDRPQNVQSPAYNEQAVDKAISTSRQKISGREGKAIKSLLGGWQERVKRDGRKSGGRTNQLTPDSLINRDVRTANEVREGVKHEGAFKKGGRTHKLGGGMIGDNPISMQNRSMSKATGMMKKGGKVKRPHHATDGFVPGTDPEGQDQITQKIQNDDGFRMGAPGRGLPADGEPVFKKSAPMVDPNLHSGPKAPRYADKMGAKKGGKIEHSDEAQDKKLMHKVLKPKAFKAEGGSAHGKDCSCKMCSGGRTMKYAGGGIFSGNSKEKIPGEVGGRKAHAKGGRTGKTTINIVMGGHGQQGQGNMPNAPVMPPRPPMGVPVPPPQMAGGAPTMGAAPQMPPQMPGRATGGRTKKMVGGSLGNAMGYGQQPAMGGYGQPQQPQQPMMGGVGQQGMMPRKSGGRTNYPIDTGAGGANARLEKIDAYGLTPPKRK